MRILHIISDLKPETGGPVQALQSLAKNQSIKNEVIILSSATKTEQPVRIEGVNIRYYDSDIFLWRWSAGLSQMLNSIIRDVDIVHLHMMWEYPILCGAKIAARLNKPFILRPCGMLDNWSLSQKQFKKRIYLKLFGGTLIKKAAAVHFTSKKEFENSAIGDAGKSCFILPIGIDFPETDNAGFDGRFYESFPNLRGKTVILFLGRLHPKKNPELLIKAFCGLADHKQAHLVLAGSADKAYLSRLMRIVNALGLNERVTFTGWLDRGMAEAALRAARIFVMPSKQENFGLSVAEAMASGCPVIVSKNLDLAEDILAARAGVAIALNEESLIRAMDQLLSSQKDAMEMGQAGKKFAKANYEINHVSARMNGIYEDILSGKHSSPAWVAHHGRSQNAA